MEPDRASLGESRRCENIAEEERALFRRPEWLEALAKVTENVVEALKEGSEITHNRAERS